MNKWQERAIKHLVNKGYDEFTASKLYARAYKRLSPSMLAEGYNRNFEAYASIAFENNFVKFDIKNNRLYYVKTGEEVSSANFQMNYTRERLSSLANKYETVETYLEQYENGQISLQQLNKNIADFKKSNSEYHKEGS